MSTMSKHRRQGSCIIPLRDRDSILHPPFYTLTLRYAVTAPMTWQSDFNCAQAKFSVGSLEKHELTGSEDHWQPVKVFVSKLSDNKRKRNKISYTMYNPTYVFATGWLMVTLAADGEPVVVWRAIQEGWTVACDEVNPHITCTRNAQ